MAGASKSSSHHSGPHCSGSAIAGALGRGFESSQEARAALAYFHATGVLVHFRDSHLVCLDPVWLFDMIAEVLRDLAGLLLTPDLSAENQCITKDFDLNPEDSILGGQEAVKKDTANEGDIDDAFGRAPQTHPASLRLMPSLASSKGPIVPEATGQSGDEFFLTSTCLCNRELARAGEYFWKLPNRDG
ncbi:unnamed protein product [Protopolystoma xenopodis]|uniref:C-terminal of Roc (COR) domain-containing protein n=1 Tax=Protopolystoma xenopodis TaxID=117903 RepID=A0A448WZJ2_9PLAT|nr:unnamed protein product [Protopolystoma xenopodis]